VSITASIRSAQLNLFFSLVQSTDVFINPSVVRIYIAVQSKQYQSVTESDLSLVDGTVKSRTIRIAHDQFEMLTDLKAYNIQNTALVNSSKLGHGRGYLEINGAKGKAKGMQL